MESDCNDTTMQQSINIQTAFDNKLKRRSSIFRPIPLTSENDNIDNTERLSTEYSDKLKQEIADWKSFYVKIKEEYRELRSGNKENHPEEATFDVPHKDYTRKAEQFCKQVNNAINIHHHLLCHESNRIEEIQNSITITNTIIHDKLKFP